MKKLQDKAVGLLIMVVIVTYPFVWLAEKIGWFGIVAIIALALGVFYIVLRSNAQKDQDDFENLVRYFLYNRVHPDESKKTNIHLAKTHFERSSLVRNIQIIQDSVYLSLHSKNRDVAEHRMRLVVNLCHEIESEYSNLISPELLNEIIQVCQSTEKEFQTKFYLNLAKGNLEKADKLKTNKSKLKYFELARSFLKEGLDNIRSEKEVLLSSISDVDQRIKKLAE